MNCSMNLLPRIIPTWVRFNHFRASSRLGSDLYDFGDLDDPDDDAEDDSKSELEASPSRQSATTPTVVVEEQKLYKSASSSKAKLSSPIYAQRHTRRRYNTPLSLLLSLSLNLYI